MISVYRPSETIEGEKRKLRAARGSGITATMGEQRAGRRLIYIISFNNVLARTCLIVNKLCTQIFRHRVAKPNH